MRGPLRRFWHRSRDWPLAGQLAFAVLVIVLIAAVVGAISNASHRDDARPPTTASTPAHPPSLAPSTSQTTSPGSTSPKVTTASRLPTLTISPQTHQDTYDRDRDFGGWIDQKGCQDTRAVLLVRASKAPVTFTSSNDCTVEGGRWIDPWSGVVATVALAFQIDHTVPLDNAWISGAWSWSPQQRVAYANDLADKDHLVAIDASENESKGADGPDQWRPPNRATWCRYALTWDRIKAKWHLSATPTEWTALVEMAATC